MSKPKILIYGNVYDTAVGQSIAYMDFFSQFGDVIIVTSEMDLDWMIEIGDILALPGGMDVLNNKAKPGFYAGKAHPHYEYLDENLLAPWLKTSKPIIGICRGMQVLNTRLGGTLHRHVIEHVQADKLDRSETPDLLFTSIDGKPVWKTNSYHHQAVKDVAEGFEVLGWSHVWRGCPSLRDSKYFNIAYTEKWRPKNSNQPEEYETTGKEMPMFPEIIRHTSRPYLAFQYHPEEFNCELANELINSMLQEYFAQQS